MVKGVNSEMSLPLLYMITSGVPLLGEPVPLIAIVVKLRVWGLKKVSPGRGGY